MNKDTFLMNIYTLNIFHKKMNKKKEPCGSLFID